MRIDVFTIFPDLVDGFCSHSLIGRARTVLIAPIGCSLALILIWFALLRYEAHIFWISPAIPWGLCLATLGISYVAGRPIHAHQVESEPTIANTPTPSPTY